MSTPVYLTLGLTLIGSALLLRLWRRTRRRLAHYRRLAERQGLIVESLFAELAEARSDLAWSAAHREAAGQLSSEATWEWRPRSGELHFSKSWKAALGYEDGDFPPALATLELLLHPHDRQRVIEQLQRFADSAEPIHELRYRLRHRDGHFLDFCCRALRTPEPGGKSDMLVAVQRAAGTETPAREAASEGRALFPASIADDRSSSDFPIANDRLNRDPPIANGRFSRDPSNRTRRLNRDLPIAKRRLSRDLSSGSWWPEKADEGNSRQGWGVPLLGRGILPALPPDSAAVLLRDGPLLLVEWDADGRIGNCNRPAKSLFSGDRNATTRFFELFSPPERERLRRECENLAAGTWVSGTSAAPAGPGKAARIHWITWARRGDGGDRRGFVSVGMELPQPLPAGGERQPPSERHGLIEGALREFQAPLAIVVTHVRKLRQHPLPPRQRQYLESISGAADSLQSLLNKLAAISGNPREQAGFNRAGFLLDQRLIDSCGDFSEACRAKGIALRLWVAPEVPQDLAGDSVRLGQVLSQLLDNAVKYTRHGSITVTVGLGQRRGERVRLDFAVADTGMGMDGQQALALLKPQRPGPPAASGLTVVRHLVRHLGGKLNIESSPERGSRIGFSAWFGCLSELPSYQAALPPAARDCKALVVESDAVARDDLAALLMRLGLRTDTAAAAPSALAMMEAAATDPYALAFLGWQPPEPDGIALAAQLRALSRDDNRPRLIVVASAGLHEVELAIGDIPVDGVLTRPVTGLHLANLIAGLLSPPPGGPIDRLMTPRCRDLSGLHILLLEDSDTSQLIATELLRDMGAEVVIAGGGPEAGKLLATASDGEFDAVLMDIEMPDLDGFETCRCIRNGGGCGTLPIIALAGRRPDETLSRYLAAGMNDFIPKPVNPQHLYNVLAHWTKPRGSRPGPVPQSAAAGHPVYTRLRGINTAVGLEFMSNKPELYERVLRDFHARFKHATVDLREALARGDYDYVRRQTHALKSLAGSIGAAELSGAAVDLESALAEPVPPASGVLEALEEALAEVLSGLQQQFLID